MSDQPTPITVAAFAGSLRRKSLNRALLHAAAELAPPYISIQILDLDLPLYNADVEREGTPSVVVDFQRAIAAADALLVATPEYNYSVTGVLKNALDWASRKYDPDEPPALQGKPLAMLGAGGRFGTLRSQTHLRYILLHNDVKVLNKPEVMLVRAGEFFDQEGSLTDKGVRGQVQELVQALYDWTIQLRK